MCYNTTIEQRRRKQHKAIVQNNLVFNNNLPFSTYYKSTETIKKVRA